jgi:hypothetical protein
MRNKLISEQYMPAIQTFCTILHLVQYNQFQTIKKQILNVQSIHTDK